MVGSPKVHERAHAPNTHRDHRRTSHGRMPVCHYAQARVDASFILFRDSHLDSIFVLSTRTSTRSHTTSNPFAEPSEAFFPTYGGTSRSFRRLWSRRGRRRSTTTTTAERPYKWCFCLSSRHRTKTIGIRTQQSSQRHHGWKCHRESVSHDCTHR